MADTAFAARATRIVTAWAQAVNDWIYKGRNPVYVTSAGTGSAYTITLPATSLYSAYTAGDKFSWKAHAVSGASATLSIIGASTLTAKSLYLGGSVVSADAIQIGDIVEVTYDGTNFQITGGTPLYRFAPSGSGTITTTVQDVIREIGVSLNAAGAVGDGVTDDTSAIQAAMANAYARVQTAQNPYTSDAPTRVRVYGEHGAQYRVTGNNILGPTGTTAFTNGLIFDGQGCTFLWDASVAGDAFIDNAEYLIKPIFQNFGVTTVSGGNSIKGRFLNHDTTISQSSYIMPEFRNVTIGAELTSGVGGGLAGITLGATTTFTTNSAHGLAANDYVLLTSITGTTEFNYRAVQVASVPTSTTFTVAVDSSAYTAWSSGGVVQQYTGHLWAYLFYLEGINGSTHSNNAGEGGVYENIQASHFQVGYRWKNRNQVGCVIEKGIYYTPLDSATFLDVRAGTDNNNYIKDAAIILTGDSATYFKAVADSYDASISGLWEVDARIETSRGARPFTLVYSDTERFKVKNLICTNGATAGVSSSATAAKLDKNGSVEFLDCILPINISLEAYASGDITTANRVTPHIVLDGCDSTTNAFWSFTWHSRSVGTETWDYKTAIVTNSKLVREIIVRNSRGGGNRLMDGRWGFFTDCGITDTVKARLYDVTVPNGLINNTDIIVPPWVNIKSIKVLGGTTSGTLPQIRVSVGGVTIGDVNLDGTYRAYEEAIPDAPRNFVVVPSTVEADRTIAVIRRTNGADDTATSQAGSVEIEYEGIRDSNSLGASAVALRTFRSNRTITTNVGNVGTGEDDLMSYTLPVQFFSADGQGLEVVAWGSTANNSNTKTVKLYFGGTAILTTALTVSQAGIWRIQATILRRSSNAQDYSAQLIQGGSTTLVDCESGTLAITDSAAIVVKCTGTVTDGGGGVNNNDILQEGMTIKPLS